MRRASRLGVCRDFSQAVIRSTLNFHQPPVRKALVLRVVPTHRRPTGVRRAQPKEPLIADRRERRMRPN